MPLLIVFFAAGLLIGSVVNWLADQLPLLHSDEAEMEEGEAAQAASRRIQLKRLQSPVCTQCGTPRPAIASIGLLAWITGQRGCSNCDRKMSIRYPIVEILTGLMFMYLYSRFDLTSVLAIYLVYMTLFVLVAVIDIETRYILNIIMLPAFVFALIEIVVSGRIRPRDAFVGYAIGQIAVMGIYLMGVLYMWNLNRDREDKITEVAFGFGDVTLATFCGLLVGFPNIIYMVVVMIIVGGVIAFLYGGYYLIVAKRYGGYVPIAYGPAILISTTIMLLWPEVITSAIYRQ